MISILKYCDKFILMYCLILFSCNQDNGALNNLPENPIYLKTIQNDSIIINWTCRSTIGSFCCSELEITNLRTGLATKVLNEYISNINLKKNILEVELWKNDKYNLDTLTVDYLNNILIDTTGNQNRNGTAARISRLQDAQIDFTKPHNYNSDFIK